MVKAVEANITPEQRWVVLYVKRWLKAPILMPEGRLAGRDRGTPQGSAVSPVLANLFMHYAFDSWLEREFPATEFERYADDAVVHCATGRQARLVLAALGIGLTDAIHANDSRPFSARVVRTRRLARGRSSIQGSDAPPAQVRRAARYCISYTGHRRA